MSTKFYLANINYPTLQRKLEFQNCDFTYTNKSHKEFVFKVSFQQRKDYYFLEFVGGQKNPYPSQVIDTENNNEIKDNPRQSGEPEISEKYSYLINNTKNYILGKANSFSILKEYYKKNFDLNITISYFCTDILEYLEKLANVTSLKIKAEVNSQLELGITEEYLKLENDMLDKLSCGEGTTVECRISPKNQDLKTFKKNIQKFNLQTITIEGNDDEGHLSKYQYDALKHIFEVTENEKLFDQLIEKFESWYNHALENQNSSQKK